MADENDVVIIERQETSLVVVPEGTAIVVETSSPSIVTQELQSIANVEVTETQVVAAGQQGPPGVAGLPGATGTHNFSVQNSESFSLTKGTPVSLVSPGVVKAASASSPDTCYALVMGDPLAAGGYGLVTDSAVLTFLAVDWDLVTENSLHKIPGAAYYLSHTPGKITNTPNVSSGVLVLVGFAVSETTFRLALGTALIL